MRLSDLEKFNEIRTQIEKSNYENSFNPRLQLILSINWEGTILENIALETISTIFIPNHFFRENYSYLRPEYP